MTKPSNTVKIRFDKVSYAYGPVPGLRDISLDVHAHAVTVFFGPAGSGKTTLLRLVNRLNDLVDEGQLSGRITIDGEDIYARDTDVSALRRRVGMVFALPLPLPGTIRENVTYGPRLAGVRNTQRLEELTVRSLTQAALWDEVKDRLDLLGTKLSGGQQQRLTLARALSHRPEILCLDEFSIAIDPVTTMKIEDILRELKNEMTIVLVTNLVQQARRLADRTALVSDSRLVEVDETETIFTRPANRLTERYVNGDFG